MARGLSQMDGVSVSKLNTKFPKPQNHQASRMIQGIVEYHLGRTIINQPDIHLVSFVYVFQNWPVCYKKKPPWYSKILILCLASKKDSQRDLPPGNLGATGLKESWLTFPFFDRILLNTSIPVLELACSQRPRQTCMAWVKKLFRIVWAILCFDSGCASTTRQLHPGKTWPRHECGYEVGVCSREKHCGIIIEVVTIGIWRKNGHII